MVYIAKVKESEFDGYEITSEADTDFLVFKMKDCQLVLYHSREPFEVIIRTRNKYIERYDENGDLINGDESITEEVIKAEEVSEKEFLETLSFLTSKYKVIEERGDENEL